MGSTASGMREQSTHQDRLSADFADTVNREQWLAVRKRLQAGEMQMALYGTVGRPP
jgi:hypothetical protein